MAEPNPVAGFVKELKGLANLVKDVDRKVKELELDVDIQSKCSNRGEYASDAADQLLESVRELEQQARTENSATREINKNFQSFLEDMVDQVKVLCQETVDIESHLSLYGYQPQSPQDPALFNIFTVTTPSAAADLHPSEGGEEVKTGTEDKTTVAVVGSDGVIGGPVGEHQPESQPKPALGPGIAGKSAGGEGAAGAEAAGLVANRTKGDKEMVDVQHSIFELGLSSYALDILTGVSSSKVANTPKPAKYVDPTKKSASANEQACQNSGSQVPTQLHLLTKQLDETVQASPVLKLNSKMSRHGEKPNILLSKSPEFKLRTPHIQMDTSMSNYPSPGPESSALLDPVEITPGIYSRKQVNKEKGKKQALETTPVSAMLDLEMPPTPELMTVNLRDILKPATAKVPAVIISQASECSKKGRGVDSMDLPELATVDLKGYLAQKDAGTPSEPEFSGKIGTGDKIETPELSTLDSQFYKTKGYSGTPETPVLEGSYS